MRLELLTTLLTYREHTTVFVGVWIVSPHAGSWSNYEHLPRMSGSATTGSSANYVSSWSFCSVVTSCEWVRRILNNIYEKVRASVLRILQEQSFLRSCWTALKMDAMHFTRRQIPDCWNLHQHYHGDLQFRALCRSIIGSKTITVPKLRSNYQCTRS